MALTKITSTNIQPGAIESSSLETSGAAAGTYGAAAKIPVLSVNAQGIVFAISEADVAGVTDFSYNSGAESLTIDTADGSSFTADISSLASQTYVDTAISNLINSAPNALDTLDELAAALGDDANFASTVTNNLAGKVDKINGSGGTVGSSTAIPVITYNAQGQITSATTTTVAGIDNVTFSNGTLTIETGDGTDYTTDFDARYFTETEANANFLGINAKAVDSDALDGLNSTQFLRSDESGSMSGTLSVTSDTSTVANFYSNISQSSGNVNTIQIYTNGLTGGTSGIALGKSGTTKNAAKIVYGHSSDTSNSNWLGLGFWDADNLMVVQAGGNVGIGNIDPQVSLDISATDAIKIPAGTTAQRPSNPSSGMVRMNTTTGSMEFYDGTGWIATNLVPSINSITGTIYVGIETTLDINITNATDTVDVRYLEGGILLATDEGVSVTAGVATSTVPAAAYGQSNGDTITIQIVNEDGTPSSNSVNKTVQGAPTGGTITTAGGYRIHTFTSSGTFTVPSGFSSSAEYLVVAGGGSGGNNKLGTYENGGGGGAGGMLTGSTTITAQSYGVTVGAGGARPSGNGQTRGNNSSALGVTCIGGGGGSTRDSQANINGGSGGGAVNWNPNTVNGIGTAGQGNNGGVAGRLDSTNGGSAGGGGKGAPGGSTSGGTVGANGGVGQISNITGSSVYYAGGGGGGGATGGTGGLGGGGNAGSFSSPNGSSGQANTGGGGGGNFAEEGNAGNGGSGIVVIRYPFTT